MKDNKLLQVRNFPFDKVYFGMPQRIGNSMKLDRPLFITPYKRIASIFAIARNQQIRSRIGGANLTYDEWVYPIQNDDYLSEVHVKVKKSQKDFEPFEIDCTGYVYEIDVSDLKDNIYKYAWMTPKLEFLIANVNEVTFSNIKTIHAHAYVDKVKTYSIIKEDYNNMEFDRMKTLRMILEADEESPNEEENTNEEETNDEAPKKKAPSRFKQNDDDVDTDTSTEDEDGEMDRSDADEDDNSDSDDLSDFGNHGGDELPNNEYDPAEVETLNNLMASEADAMNEYLDAARVSKVDVLQRLYADIANEERFHMEQLLFAKSELTGEKYVPRDKDVRKEYEELLELGMDEDSAMATAVDKVGIKVTINDHSDEEMQTIKNNMQEIEDDAATLEAMVQQIELLSYICDYATRTNNAELLNEINIIQESHFIVEDVTPGANVDKKYTQTTNPFKALFNLFIGFLKLLRKLANNSKNLMKNIKFQIGKRREWIAKNGIQGLFAEGVYLYTWNDSKNQIDLDGFSSLADATWQLCQLCCNMSKSTNQAIQNVVQNRQPIFVISNSQYKKTYRNPQSIIDVLNNVNLIKSKVIYTDDRKDYLTKLFFGDYKEIVVNPKQPYDLSRAINDIGVYAVFTYMIDRLNLYAEYSEKAVEGFAHMEGEPNGIYHTNNKLYNDIGKWMKAVGSNFSKLTNIVTHDMNKITSIAAGQQPDVHKPEDLPNGKITPPNQQPQQPDQQQKPNVNDQYENVNENDPDVKQAKKSMLDRIKQNGKNEKLIGIKRDKQTGKLVGFVQDPSGQWSKMEADDVSTKSGKKDKRSLRDWFNGVGEGKKSLDDFNFEEYDAVDQNDPILKDAKESARRIGAKVKLWRKDKDGHVVGFYKDKKGSWHRLAFNGSKTDNQTKQKDSTQPPTPDDVGLAPIDQQQPQQPQQPPKQDQQQPQQPGINKINEIIKNSGDQKPGYISMTKMPMTGKINMNYLTSDKKAPFTLLKTDKGQIMVPSPGYLTTNQSKLTVKNYKKIYGDMFDVELTNPAPDGSYCTLDNFTPTLVTLNNGVLEPANGKKGTIYLNPKT